MKKRKVGLQDGGSRLVRMATSLRQMVLGYLDTQHVASFRTVCRAFTCDRALWPEISADKWFALTVQLAVASCVQILDVQGTASACLNSIAYGALTLKPRKIECMDCHVDDNAMRFISSFPTLEVLVLIECSKLTDKGLAHLSRATWLKELYLVFSRVTEAGLAHVAKLRELTTLNLRGSQIARLDSLAHLPLKFINLWQCKQITDEAMASVAMITTLEKLDLGECTSLTNEALAEVTKIAGLRELSLFKCTWVNDKGLEHLSALQKLSLLGLHSTGISDFGLVFIAKMSGLRQIDLRMCKLSLFGLSMLPPLCRLIT